MLPRRHGLLALLVSVSVSGVYACSGGSNEVVPYGGGNGTSGRKGVAGSAGSGAAGTSSAGASSGGAASTAGAAGSINLGAGNTGAGNGGAAGTSSATTISLAIDPPSTTLQVVDNVPQSATLKAIGTSASGATQQVNAVWSIDAFDVGKISPDGVFTATGPAGGVVTVTAKFAGIEAKATVAVTLSSASNPGPGNGSAGPVDPADIQPLQDGEASGGTTEGPTGKILYPYDNTMFAKGLVAPEIMWDGGAAGDKVLVHLHSDYFDAKVFLTAADPGRFLLPADVWTAATESNHGEPLKVTITRMNAAGQVGVPMTGLWNVAQGNLRGTIYYWAVSKGQIMKIGPGKDAPTPVFDSGSPAEPGTPLPKGAPPNVTWDASGEKRCVACHTVSKDGSTLVSGFSGTASMGTRPWGAVDLKQKDGQDLAKIVSFSDSSINSFGVTLTPDGNNVVAATDPDNKLHFFDTKSGERLPSEIGTYTDQMADPMFSPDGHALSFVGNIVSPGWKMSGRSSSLEIVPFDPVSLTFGNRTTLLPAQPNVALGFPTFSPDSQWVLYQKGNCMSHLYCDGSAPGTPGKFIGRNDISLVSAAGGQEIALDAANGVGYLDEKNLHVNYEPRVNPIAVGGYMWYIFVSVRDYGNKMVAADPASQNHKQLWVAAVDLNPTPGKDPSHPPFLLRGQDEVTHNMSGYWTLDPCKDDGQGCASGTQCCSGFCRADENGEPVCVDKPTTDTTGGMGDGGQSGAGGSGPPPCSNIEEKCTKASDCCGGASTTCIGGYCTIVPPK
jgi:hypothetical protein